MLTVAEAAKKTGVEERNIKEWMDRGILDYSRVDNFIFIDSRALQKAIYKDGKEFLGCMYNKWVEAGRLER